MQISIKTSQNAFRRKRSADEFPDDMDIELPVGESHVSIALHRNYHISNKVPVTVERHGKIVRQRIEDTQVIYFALLLILCRFCTHFLFRVATHPSLQLCSFTSNERCKLNFMLVTCFMTEIFPFDPIEIHIS